MLHQVKKGVWEHLLKFFQELISTTYEARTANKYLTELDLRFTFVPPYPGLKKFPKGITQLPQVTGSEYFQIMNVGFALHELADCFCFKIVSWVARPLSQKFNSVLVL